MSLPIDTKYVRLISHRVRNFKQKKDYLWNFSCPLCGDSQKNKSKARGYVFQKGNNLYYSCHNCGASTTLYTLLKHIDPTIHQEYVLERFKKSETSTKPKHINYIPQPRFDKVDTLFENAEFCDKLSEEHYCVQYLKNRKIPKEMYSKLLFTKTYKDFIDNLVPDHGKEIVNDDRLVIPFYGKYNELLAVSGRALSNSDNKLRYITVRTTESDDKLIYGLERVDFSKQIKIVEGPIDSLFLKNCVASCDGNLIFAAQRIMQLGANKDNIVLISDNEPRNKEITKLIDKGIKEGYNTCIWPDTIRSKDINEMIVCGVRKDVLESIISKNVVRGVEAQLKFNYWKKV